MDEHRARALAERAAGFLARYLADGAAADAEFLTSSADQIEPALLLVVAAGDRELGLRGAAGLSVFWQDAGLVAQGRSTTEAVLAAAGDEASSGWARAALVVGELAFRQSDQASALRWTSRASEAGRQAGDSWVMARAEINLARVAFRDGDATGIARHARAALDLGGGDQRVEISGHHMLGWASHTSGDTSGAIDAFRTNADRYAAVGDPVGEASELANVADLAMESGEHATATELLGRALHNPAAMRSKYLAPSLVRSAGVLMGLLGDRKAAVSLLEAADELYRRYGSTPDPGDQLSEEVRRTSEAAIGPDEVERCREWVGAQSDGALLEYAQATVPAGSND